MILKPISGDVNDFPTELRSLLTGGKLYDSSCSQEARRLKTEV